MKRRILALILCVTTLFLLCGCSTVNLRPTDGSMPPNVPDVPEASNTVLSFCNFRFSVPVCFGELDQSASTSTEKWFHPHDNDTMQLAFSAEDAEMSQQLFDFLKPNLLSTFVSGHTDLSANVQTIRSEATAVGGLSAQTTTFTGKNLNTGKSMLIYATSAYDLGSAKVIAIFLMQPADAEYDFAQEYEQLLSSATFEGEPYLPCRGSPTILEIGGIEFTLPACFGELDESNSDNSGKWYNPERFSPIPALCLYYYSDGPGYHYTKEDFISELNDESLLRGYANRIFFEAFDAVTAEIK